MVKDSKYTGVRDEIPRQVFFAFMENDTVGGAVMYVRTTSQPDAAFGAVRQVVRQLDSNIPIYNLRTLEHQIDQSLLNDRLIATLSTALPRPRKRGGSGTSPSSSSMAPWCAPCLPSPSTPSTTSSRAPC